MGGYQGHDWDGNNSNKILKYFEDLEIELTMKGPHLLVFTRDVYLYFGKEKIAALTVSLYILVLHTSSDIISQLKEDSKPKFKLLRRWTVP
jgi:hypothetical protein